MKTGAPQTFGRLSLRLSLALAALAAETCFIAFLGHPWMRTHQISTAPIIFLAALLFFGRKRLQTPSLAISLRDAKPFTRRFLTLHFASFFAMLTLQVAMIRTHASGLAIGMLPIALWFLLLALMAFAMLAAVAPARILAKVGRQLGSAWAYALVCALLVVFARSLEYLAWDAPSSWLGNRLASATFAGVHFLLGLFYKEIIADSAARILGTPYFLIRVAGSCSGIEGLGLTLVLTVGWIIYERRRLRIARALYLVPLALALTWCLNLVRLTALIAIGVQGHSKLALTGFHTEAGWIAFTIVAIGFLLAASHIPWFQSNQVSSHSVAGTLSNRTALATVHNPTAYLLPFFAILATSLFTRAASTGFEAFYPFRLLVVLAIFWMFRKRYIAMSKSDAARSNLETTARWRFCPIDLAAGAAVGILWVFVARHADSSVIANGLAGLSRPARVLWLASRGIAAVVTVPLAEELAFRGFLARRTISENFETIQYGSLTLLSILISSLAFGAMHGGFWLLGMLSGIVFALVARLSNSLGSAVAAHATANLVLVVAAIGFGNYGLW